MSRVMTTGWETGDLNEVIGSVDRLSGLSASNAAVNSVPLPRSGGNYCLKTLVTVDGSGSAWRVLPFENAQFNFLMRWGMYISPAALGGADEYAFATQIDASGVFQNCITWSQVDHRIRLRLGGTTSGALLAVSFVTVSPGQWNVFRSHTTIGSLHRLYVGSAFTQLFEFSGDNAAGAGNVASLAFGLSGTDMYAGAYVAFDDLAVNNTSGASNTGYPGDGRVVLLVPTGPGALTQLQRGGEDTGANWSQVNELPPSMAQHVVTSSQAGYRDFYTMSDLPPTTGAVAVVEAVVLADKSEVGSASVNPQIRSGSSIYETTWQQLNTTPSYHTARWEHDPQTFLAWTVSSVNALQAGVRVS
jgi:hypothetical protein